MIQVKLAAPGVGSAAAAAIVRVRDARTRTVSPARTREMEDALPAPLLPVAELELERHQAVAWTAGTCAAKARGPIRTRMPPPSSPNRLYIVAMVLERPNSKTHNLFLCLFATGTGIVTAHGCSRQRREMTFAAWWWNSVIRRSL